jgi:hypothetical protein
MAEKILQEIQKGCPRNFLNPENDELKRLVQDVLQDLASADLPRCNYDLYVAECRRLLSPGPAAEGILKLPREQRFTNARYYFHVQNAAKIKGGYSVFQNPEDVLSQQMKEIVRKLHESQRLLEEYVHFLRVKGTPQERTQESSEEPSKSSAE